MKNLKISTKLIINTAITLIILVVLGVYAYYSINDIVDNKAALMNENAESETLVLELRKHEKDFLMRDISNENYYETSESKYLTKFGDTQDLFLLHLEAMKDFETLKKSAEMTEDIDMIIANLNKYSTLFSQVASAYTQRGYRDYGLIGELRAAVHALDDEALQFDDEHIQTLILRIRKDEKDYFLTADVSYIEKIHQKTTELESYISGSSANSNLKSRMLASLNQYEEAFDSITEIDEIIGRSQDEGLTGEYRETVSRIEPLVQELKGSIEGVIDSEISTMLRNTLLFIVVAVLISIALSAFIIKSITKPLASLVIAADKIADGDLDVDIISHSKDEIGILSKSFEKMTTNINDVLANINTASIQVASGSTQLSDSSMSLSQGATEQASSIEELSASIDEITTQTHANAKNAEEAKGVTAEAHHYAIEGNGHMQNMLQAMNDINESSSNISKIIKVIDDIAFQTNILALNAAVEAARAGQHGKGFAVVADEVRNLAAKSANAAKETTVMIEESIVKVDEGTTIAKSTADALTMIVNSISTITNSVNDISTASQEQAIGVEQISQGLTQISDVVQTTSATAEETAAASEELQGQAETLKTQVASFKLKGNTHVSAIQRTPSSIPDNRSDSPAKYIALNVSEFDKY